MVEPMLQHDTGHRDAEHTGVGEVGQAKAPRRMLLAEDDVLLRSNQGPPRPDAPFQSAPDAGADLGMAPAGLGQNGNGAQSGHRLQDRHDLGVQDIGQRIGPPPAAPSLLL